MVLKKQSGASGFQAEACYLQMVSTERVDLQLLPFRAPLVLA